MTVSDGNSTWHHDREAPESWSYTTPNWQQHTYATDTGLGWLAIGPFE